jgi:hypothetical protein
MFSSGAIKSNPKVAKILAQETADDTQKNIIRYSNKHITYIS